MLHIYIKIYVATICTKFIFNDVINIGNFICGDQTT